MRAVVCSAYGLDGIRLGEIAQPVPKDDEVLIKVRAAAFNALDWHFMRGTPYFSRVFSGWRKPKAATPGSDVAGIVEAVGKNVTRWKPGDAVFGACRGTAAEYVCNAETRLAKIPESVTFEQAASIPVAGLTALQGLRDHAHVRAGQQVLVNGASGGVGSFAVQVAKAFGANVTAVCHTKHVELVRSLGADHVIDYTRDDFTQQWRRYDVIFDCVGNHPLSIRKRLLNPGGVAMMVGIRVTPWYRALGRILIALTFARFDKTLGVFMAKSNAGDLAFLAELVAKGAMTPAMRIYAFDDALGAIRQLATEHPGGKIVITMGERRDGASCR